MTSEERIAKFANDAMPATHWLALQMDDLDRFFDTLVHRKGSKSLRDAIHAERCAVLDAFKVADAKEREAARLRLTA